MENHSNHSVSFHFHDQSDSIQNSAHTHGHQNALMANLTGLNHSDIVIFIKIESALDGFNH